MPRHLSPLAMVLRHPAAPELIAGLLTFHLTGNPLPALGALASAVFRKDH